MMDHLLIPLSAGVDTLYRMFVFPGEALLSVFASLAPRAVAILTIDNGAIIVPLVLALLAWTLAVVAGLMVLRFVKSVLREVDAIVRTIIRRITTAIGDLKFRIVWTLRKLMPRRKVPADGAGPMIEFDDIELAVLRSGCAGGPGFALSAPELAEKFTLRPSQVQRRLERLSKIKMLASVIGSTDGYENYRLTDSGLAFIMMWQRQQARP